MTKTVTVQARMEPELKQQAESILAALGMNSTTAITLFYTQLVRQRGMPFELKLPNEETRAAIEESKSSKFKQQAKRYKNAAELLSDLKD